MYPELSVVSLQANFLSKYLGAKKVCNSIDRSILLASAEEH